MATVEIDSVKIFDTLTPMQQDELLDSLNEKQYSGDEVVIEQVGVWQMMQQHTGSCDPSPLMPSHTHSLVLLLVACFRTQGSENSMFYLITHGKVKVMQQNAPGVLAGERELATLEQGNYFGERAILKTEPAMASVRADKDGVTCYTLDRIHFNKILGSSLKAQVSHSRTAAPHSHLPPCLRLFLSLLLLVTA